MSTLKFNAADIKTFLLSLDRRLTKPVYFEVIGSAAAMIAFGMDRDTKDFDTVASVDAISKAWDETAQETGLDIPLDKVSVHQPPDEYESRLREVKIPDLKNIRISVPEKHDWALMKIARGYDKDLEHILDVSIRMEFNHETFFDRFINEMWVSHGYKGDLIYSFVTTMEALFGSEIAKKMDKVIRADPRWQL